MWSTLWLTPCSRIFPEIVTDSRPVKFLAFYGSRRFITAFKSARQLPLSRAKSTQSMPPHSTYWRSILIFSPSTHVSSKWSLSLGSLRGQLCIHMYICVSVCVCIIYRCHRRNGPNFGRVFLMLNYTDITQNTYVPSWTVIEIMAK